MSPPGRRRARPTAVYLESGTKRVFACAVDWPGWARAGKGEEAALEALATYASRYASVAAEAGMAFPPASAGSFDVGSFDVVERVPGSATTDFGAPGAVPSLDRRPLAAAEADRQVALVAAAWALFDRVAAGAPAELRKGPRGGGRDRDAIVEHVRSAEVAYVRKLGLRSPAKPDPADAEAVAAMRIAVLDALGATGSEAPSETAWPRRYAARRIAWHALDHAWEIEDRSPPA